jgi:osmoprotectant transport system substrate-binding protein
MRKPRRYVLGAVVLAFGLLLGACGSGEDGTTDTTSAAGGGEKPTLTVGSEGFAEAQIVGEMYAQVLENAGYTVNRKLDVSSREIRIPAMEKGDIDIAPDYVASLLAVIDPKADLSGDVTELADTLAPKLDEKGLELLEPSNVVDTNAFVTTKDIADANSLTKVSDLAPVAADMTLGGPPECPKRPYCAIGLKDVYGVEFGDFKPLEYGATITALSGGAIDVGLLYSTDGSIAENGFVLLEDDKGLQSADNITPLVRSDIATDEVVGLLNDVSAALDTAKITDLNKRANVDAEDTADLATEYLQDVGLL